MNKLLKHIITVKVKKGSNEEYWVMRTAKCKLPKWLRKFLIGDTGEIVLIMPYDSVIGYDIQEVPEDYHNENIIPIK